MSLEKLLDQVHDRESFIAFVQALAEDREQAEELERANPPGPALCGALNWQNIDISAFLHAALCCFDHPDNRDAEAPSWQLFAEFLYFGKIYE